MAAAPPAACSGGAKERKAGERETKRADEDAPGHGVGGEGEPEGAGGFRLKASSPEHKKQINPM